MSALRGALAAIVLAALASGTALAQPTAPSAALTARAEAGDPAAMRALGTAAFDAQKASLNRADIRRNEAEAIRWYKMAADKGDAAAMHLLGVLYASRDASAPPPTPAPPVEAGQERFQVEIGDDDDRSEDPNMQEAVRWFRMAADKGDANGMFGLGTSYADGSGVKPNGQEAVRWLSRAAELGNTDAMVNLGFYYARGGSVAKDNARSLEWYRRAADLGNPVAMFTLGVKAHEGEGVERSYAEAVRWERMAADKGYAAAMLNLGHYYARGEGVPKNEAESLRWYRLAATNGSREASELLSQRGIEVQPGR
jgi:TPR repeat protein